MKSCPECGDRDYRYYQEGNDYFLVCTNCGFHAEEEQVQKLESAEELIVDKTDRTENIP